MLSGENPVWAAARQYVGRIIMKKHTKMLAIAAAGLLCAALPVYAENDTANDPDDIVMLYTDTRSRHRETPLCDVINQQRAGKGVAALTQSDALMEQAAERVEKLSGNQGGADVGVLEAEHACETVIRGRADINTAICSMIISEQQQKPLLCEAYSQFGYACSEDNLLWVFLFTE